MKIQLDDSIFRTFWDDPEPPATKYSDDEPRDDHGRWTDGGGGSGDSPKPQTSQTVTAQSEPGSPNVARLTVAPEAQRQMIRNVEPGIMQKPFENGYMATPDGRVVGPFTSGSEEFITRDAMPMRDDEFRDGVFTHNHPFITDARDPASVSSEDLKFAIQYNLREVRAVRPDGSGFFIRRTGDRWPTDWRGNALPGKSDASLMSKYSSVISDLHDEWGRAIKAGEMTRDDANQRGYREIWRRVLDGVKGVKGGPEDNGRH